MTKSAKRARKTHYQPTPRRDTYRKAEDIPAQLLAIRRLRSRGYSCARIAEYLSGLTPAQIDLLERCRRWNAADIEGALQPLPIGEAWNERQVEYWVDKLGLTAKVLPNDGMTLQELRHQAWREYQRRAGWLHLLPRFDRDTGRWVPTFQGSGFVGPLKPSEEILTPRDCDILSLLRDNGPMTKWQLMRGLGLRKRRLYCGNRSRLNKLIRMGLAGVSRKVIDCDGRPRLQTLYDLMPGVALEQRRRKETGVEALCKRLGVQ